MFSQPKPLITQSLNVLGEVKRAMKCLRRTATLTDVREIKDGKSGL